jgi:hypothetical protein
MTNPLRFTRSTDTEGWARCKALQPRCLIVTDATGNSPKVNVLGFSQAENRPEASATSPGHGNNGVWLVEVCTGELTHFDTEWSNPASAAFSPPGPPELRAPPLELFRR